MSEHQENNNEPKKRSRKRRGRSEGSIFLRGDGQWVASISLGYDAHGKHVRKTVYGSSKAVVMEKLKGLQLKSGQLTQADAGQMTVSKFLAQWLEAVNLKVSKGTFKNYSQHVNDYLGPKLGSIKLAKLSTMNVEMFYRQLTEDGHSASLQRHVGVTLRAALAWAMRHRLLDHNVASGKLVALPSHSKREIRALEPTEIGSFLEAARRDRLYALYVLAIDSGCRQGELLGMQWGDLDFGQGTITIQRSLEEVNGTLALKPPKTKQSRRTVTLTAFTLAALSEHRKAMLAEGSYGVGQPVFCGSRNKTWLRKSDLFRHSFAPILKACGLKFRFHDMRHACASLLLAGGTDLKTVQDRLGHSTAMMTLSVYAHTMRGAQSAAAAKLNAILESTRKGAVQTA
jgi:integrase